MIYAENYKTYLNMTKLCHVCNTADNFSNGVITV